MTHPISVRRADLDVEGLRDKLSDAYKEYDEVTKAQGFVRAGQLKKEVTGTLHTELAKVVSKKDRGIYIFRSEGFSPESLKYIGISNKGNLYKRFHGRFQDEACLDRRLYDTRRDQLWDDVFERIRISMPDTPLETAVRYAFKHMKTTLLFKSASRVSFFITDASDDAIKSAESLLIYSAVSLGAPLLNIQERDNLKTDFRAGEDLAYSVIDASGVAVEEWFAKAKALSQRFSSLR